MLFLETRRAGCHRWPSFLFLLCRSQFFLRNLLTAKPKHRLGRALFLLNNMFLALVLQNLNRSG